MLNPYTLCVAPMLDWTDRHCRYFHRLIAPNARLYTEMVTTGALRYADQSRHLDFSAIEHPVALQLGGSDRDDLVFSAKLGQQWGYDEINLNCGCPSERVQKGAFGACLMAEPKLVADAIKAMQDAVSIPITVKHRIGLDYNESYDQVQDFVATLYDAGCRVFIVHARNAVLKGLSPRQNRQIPPIRYMVAEQLKQDFADATIVVNGELNSASVVQDRLTNLDGVMIGRMAYQSPRYLSLLDQTLFPDSHALNDEQIIQALHQYTVDWVAGGGSVRAIVRHVLGWCNDKKGAKRWRQMLSDHKLLLKNDPDLIMHAWTEFIK